MRDSDLVLIGRATLLGAALICQRIAAFFGRLAITAEARYAALTEVAR
jgi:hypothetical protein